MVHTTTSLSHSAVASNPSEEGNVGVQNGGASRSRGDGVGTSAIPNDDDEKSKIERRLRIMMIQLCSSSTVYN